jgi:integrase
MERSINNVVDGLLSQVEAYGSREPTVRLYRDVFKSLINHCCKKVDEPYTDLIPDEFLKKTEENFENGNHCYEYYRFTKRTIRLLDTFARTGKPDFSSHRNLKKYMPSLEHQELIKKIIDENQLVNDARIEMDTIMRHFFCFLEEASIDPPSLDDGILFRFIQEASTTKQGTMYRVVRAVRLISEHMKKHSMAELKADFSMIQAKSAPVRMIHPYSHDEISRIMEYIDVGTPGGTRDQAILLLAFETGLRAVDIIKLRRSDIDWINAEVRIAQSKTRTPITLPLNGMVMNAMADYILKARPERDSDKVFLRLKSPNGPLSNTCSLGAIVEKYCKLAGVEKKPFRSFHSLRRSFATELSAAGVPLPTISQLLGHKSIKEARPYLTYDRSQTLFCAMGFDGIPVVGDIYASAPAEPTLGSLEGGEGE